MLKNGDFEEYCLHSQFALGDTQTVLLNTVSTTPTALSCVANEPAVMLVAEHHNAPTNSIV